MDDRRTIRSGYMRTHKVLCSLLVLAAAGNSVYARQPVRARHAMVVAEEANAADAGVRVLKNGGNAVDAAVAIGFALAVTHPSAGNLGGGGFMLLRMADGRTAFVDFRERAPQQSSRDMYLGEDGTPTRDSIEGWKAAGVPGTVRGLELAHRKWGTRTWSELVGPAIQLARFGFVLSYGQANSIGSNSALRKFPESRHVFQNDGLPFEAGDLLVQADLARTLERIAKEGARDFYEGETARILARQMELNGGLITLEDLRGYEAIERKPLQGCYKGHEIFTAPPPSSGGIGILQMLGMLENSGYEKPGPGSAAVMHYLAEVMRRYYADRSRWLGDPDFTKVPVAALLDPAYIEKRRASIDPAHATPSDALSPGAFGEARESSQTTHYSVVDVEGNAVAVTYTLNGGFGSGVTVPGLGILLNNEMEDFSVKPGEPNMFGLVQGEANAIEPRKRPLSSMTPTIVTRSGKLFLVLGGPGGGRIITSVLQTIVNIVDFGMNVQDAVDRPRLHHQWKPDKLFVEPGFSPDTIQLLESRGHTVDETGPQSLIEAILVEGSGWLAGASDGGRSEAKAAGF